MSTKTRKRKRTEKRNVYFGVRVDAELIEKLRRRAEENYRNIGQELNMILKTALSEPRKGE